MGLLDDDYVPPWTPPKPKRYEKQTALTQEARDKEFNNHDRIFILDAGEVAEEKFQRLPTTYNRVEKANQINYE